MKINLKSQSSNSQTFYNFLSTALLNGISFLSMPVFTRMLGSEQYGRYSVYASWLAIISCFMGFNIFSCIGTGLYKFKHDYNRFRTSVLLEGIIICAAICLVGVVFIQPLSHFFKYPVYIVILMLLESSALFIVKFSNSAWIYEKKALNNMIVSVTLSLLSTGLSIFLLIIWHEGTDDLYIARVSGNAVPYILVAFVLIVIFFRKQKICINKKYWSYGLKFGVPIIFHGLAGQVLAQSDRIMMQNFEISDSEIGIYSFFYSFSAVVSTILYALNNSWCPFFIEDLSNENYAELNKKIKNYSHLFTTISCGFLLLSREVVRIFAGEEFWSGIYIIPILVLPVYLNFLYQFAVNYEFYMEKTNIIAIGTAFSAVVNIILNAILIPLYGMLGAAIATFIGYAALAIMHIIVVKCWKLKRYPLSFAPILKGMLVVVAVSAIYYLLADLWLVRWVFGAILGLNLIRVILKRKTIF